MSATCPSSQAHNLSLIQIMIHSLFTDWYGHECIKVTDDRAMNIQITALIELFIFYQTAYKKEIHSEIYIGRLLARQYRQELQSQEIKEWWSLCIMEQYVIVWFYAIFSKSSFTAQMDPQLCSMLSYTQCCVIISYRVVSILFSLHCVAPNPVPKLYSNPARKRGWLILAFSWRS